MHARSSATLSAIVAAVFVLWLWPSLARAESEAAPERAPPLARTLVLGTNPIAPIGGRWGVSLEWLAARHHALTGSIAWVDVEPACCRLRPGGWSSGLDENYLRGVALELGYRLYSSSDRPEGLWLAPSLVLFRGSGMADGDPISAIGQVGLAMDAGAQVLLFDRLALGAGLGLQAVAADREIETGFDDDTPVLFPPPGDRYARSHVAPRLLATLGVAF